MFLENVLQKIKSRYRRPECPTNKFYGSAPTATSIRDEELQSAFDAINSVFWIIDKDHTILRANKASEQFFKRTNQEIIGKKCWTIVHGTEDPVCGCPAVKSKQSLCRESMELLIGHRWYNVIVDPLLDPNGNLTRCVHIITEITDRKMLFDQLKRQRRLLSDTEHLAKTGGWEWDVKHHKMFWTSGLYRLHGFDPEKYAPGSDDHIRASIECYKPQDRSIVQNAFHQCADTGRPYDLQFEITKSNGSRIWIRTAARPVWNGDTIEKVTGHVIDISDFKLARDELLVQTQRLSTFFNAIDDAVFVHPLQKQGFGAFVEVNSIACRRYGYTYDEFMNLTPEDITVEPDILHHGQPGHRRRLLETGQLVFETVHVKKTGETFPVEINSNVFHQQNRTYILAVVRDIGDRKKEECKREKLIAELQAALEKINTLRGLIPICSWCKKIRDDQGYWNVLESYIQNHSEATFSHGICPDCARKLRQEARLTGENDESDQQTPGR